MTENQKKFADEYIKCGNATKAYKIAYPKVKKDETAKAAASRLLTYVAVKEYIKDRNKEISNSRIADMQEVKEFWTAILRDRTEKAVDRLKASEFIARTNGAFLDKMEVKGLAAIQIIDDIPKGEGDG